MATLSDIDPTTTNTLSSGETLDGNGETLTVDGYVDPVIEAPEGCTIRNVDFVGPFIDDTADGGWWDYEESGTAWETAASAIEVLGDNVTIENVTCRGWSHAGIQVGNIGDSRYQNVVIQNCELIDNNCRALGYGVVVYSGEPIIEWCDFNNNRHDIAASGERNCAYEARYNWVGPVGRIYGFEMHPPGGDWVNVHHNTFEDKHGNTPRKGYDRKILIRNRGVPASECLVENNWFKGPDDVDEVVLMSDDARSMYTFNNNHVGSSEPPEDVGQPANQDFTPGAGGGGSGGGSVFTGFSGETDASGIVEFQAPSGSYPFEVAYPDDGPSVQGTLEINQSDVEIVVTPGNITVNEGSTGGSNGGSDDGSTDDSNGDSQS